VRTQKETLEKKIQNDKGYNFSTIKTPKCYDKIKLFWVKIYTHHYQYDYKKNSVNAHNAYKCTQCTQCI